MKTAILNDSPVFEEFFSLGAQESKSPFLTPQSRPWGTHLKLKASILSTVFLLTAFGLSFHLPWNPLSNILLIFVYFLAGIPSLIESVEDLTHFEINIDVLMTLAAFSSVLIGSPMEGGLLLVLFSLSGSMEEAVTAKAKGAINQLHRLTPKKAHVIEEDGTLIERSVKEIPVNTLILVKAGEIVPLDGLVVDGISSVNLAHLTGEHLPITKKLNDTVAAGAENLEGSLTLRITHTSENSTLAHIIQLVTQAQNAKPKLQRWFDKVSKTYAISIITLSSIFALTFPWLFSIPLLGQEGSIYRALAFLIAASPCALIIAIPIAYLSAISTCARKGILLKGGITLDALNQCSIIALDKTGTLTTGNLSLMDIQPLEPDKPHDLSTALSVSLSLEQKVVHPIAKAILQYSKEKGIKPFNLRNFISVPGFGMEATVSIDNKETKAFLGRPQYILSKMDPQRKEKLSSLINKIEKQGELIAVLSLLDQIYWLKFSDTLRPKTKDTLKRLKQKKRWQLVMLTGDHPSSANKVAKELGIDDVFSELTPEDKLEHVSRLSLEKGLAFVGDGINDAPALARATVGICMGKIGSTTAAEAADVVLLHDNLEHLDWLMEKASKTNKIVKQNLFIASLAILIATGPSLAGLIPLWLAVVLHEGGTVLVGLNALKLLRK